MKTWVLLILEGFTSTCQFWRININYKGEVCHEGEENS